MAMYQGRSVAGTAPGDGLLKSKMAGYRISPVDLGEVEVWEICHQPRDIAAGSVDLNRDRDRIFIVFDDEQDRQPSIGGGVQRLPELPLAGRALAERDIDHFVGVEFDILELAIIA